MSSVRRKRGQLLPLEVAICHAAQTLGESFHGYQMAKLLQKGAAARRLTAFGTLYRALARLENMGLLTSRWEDPRIPAKENRPGRRLYSLTAEGEFALNEAKGIANSRTRRRLKRRWVPA